MVRRLVYHSYKRLADKKDVTQVTETVCIGGGVMNTEWVSSYSAAQFKGGVCEATRR